MSVQAMPPSLVLERPSSLGPRLSQRPGVAGSQSLGRHVDYAVPGGAPLGRLLDANLVRMQRNCN